MCGVESNPEEYEIQLAYLRAHRGYLGNQENSYLLMQG